MAAACGLVLMVLLVHGSLGPALNSAAASASPWRSEHDEWESERDKFLDEDGTGHLEEEGTRRIRMPPLHSPSAHAHADDDNEWDVDFERMLLSEMPWGPGEDDFQDVARHFSSEPPEEHPEHNEQLRHSELDDLDVWE